MQETVLKATDISVTRGSSEILSNVSLRIPADARLLIQGPSGAGKTTLFNILGLLDTPSSGKLMVMGSDASTLPERERARLRRDTIGFIFQDFQLISDLTAWENAAVPQDHTGERDESWLKTLFTQLDIADLTDQYPATLSGGEKQRVAIARALANRPAIILADEPTGQLDPDTTDKVLELLFEVQESTDTALVTISHDVQLSPLYQDTMFLADGDIVERKVEP
ncbi:ABC transporter ATP-binding protein [Haladaptatus halobius]|jgi:ABC-type lipoprotein export system ATPase subunit|uniref:ABC transporter ATP-binding protein n=1 Tax=Haladaptatus halobius TaxID=2884875 RepID=UPI001D0AEC9A|nr:ABC transporter ATP-binding protein [Haladaptatus halobius]